MLSPAYHLSASLDQECGQTLNTVPTSLWDKDSDSSKWHLLNLRGWLLIYSLVALLNSDDSEGLFTHAGWL